MSEKSIKTNSSKGKTSGSRIDDLIHFYAALERLESGFGEKRRLLHCHGRMNWPERGVCFFFEENESRSRSGNGPRVVFVGTHAVTRGSKANLWDRLSTHRGSAKTGGGNHRGSIFRLLVGEALMERDPECQINTWGKGASAPADMRAAESELERAVSRSISEMPFLWLEVDDLPGPKSLRNYIKRNVVALLSGYNRVPTDPPSDGWLGNHSPREKINRSGLWNQEHVKDDYDSRFLSVLEELVARQIGKIKSHANAKNMIVVIQCAAGKNQAAGHMLAENGQRVMFVANPQNAPLDRSTIYKRPDDPVLSELSWRDLLVKYNKKYKDAVSENPLGLLPAWRLYKNSAYEELISAFGIENVFILSAGWGLIPAKFLTPNYDITFSARADIYKRRRHQDLYKDLAILPKDIEKPVIFLGGKNYIPMFCSLTEGIKSERTVFYNSETVPDAPGCRLCRFSTKTRTNWHYECARELARGNIDTGKSQNAGSKETRTVSKREISKALIEFAKDLEHSEDLEMPKKISTKKDANHFFVGVMLDRIVKTSVAWNSGKLIVKEYGGGKTDFWKIIRTINRDELHEFMKSGDGGKALHRYHGKMTDNLKRAAGLMLEKYDGDPRKIWQVEKDNIEKIKRRFKEFHGIEEQLASMAVMILVRDYKELGGKKSFPFLVPKEDVHTKKVFRRTGLIEGRQTVVEVAKELNPDFPAILDEPAWIIGREYCFKNNPNCKECPITGVCDKNI